MSGQLHDDYEALVLAGVKRVMNDRGEYLLDRPQQEALERLIASGLAAREGDAFVLRQTRYATVDIDPSTQPLLDTLHTLWLRLEEESAANDEILYGELGYWQHWGNVLNDGTDREASPLRIDVMVPERGSLLSRQWARELDPAIVEHVFSNKLVDVRLLVPPAAHGSSMQTMIETVIAGGVHVRVFPSDIEFTLYDGQTAVVRDESHADELQRHRLTRRPGVVDPLVHLFELRWSAAIPWDGFVRGTGGILQLLAQGWTDARIADALGTSPRTVSRRIAEIMQAAGAESRFQLGMKHALQELGPQSADPQ